MNIAILLPIAAKLGLPVLTRILARHGGETGGAVAEALADIGAVLGVAPTPEAISDAYSADPVKAGPAIAATESANGDRWLGLVEEGLKGQFGLLMAEQRSGGWRDGWRPGGMYLLAFLWAWTFVILPVVNAAFAAAILPPDLSTLSWLTSLFMGLYMGGHTVKDLADKAREAVTGRKA